MQPLLKQITYGALIGWPWSTMARVPGCIDMPSGKREAENLLRIAVRLDQHGRSHRLAGLSPGVLAGEADQLGVGLLAF